MIRKIAAALVAASLIGAAAPAMATSGRDVSDALKASREAYDTLFILSHADEIDREAIAAAPMLTAITTKMTAG